VTALDLAAYTLELAQTRRATGGTLRWGSRNTGAIKALQNRLSSLGYATEADGQWGGDTEKQFRAFQQAHGLKVDGVLGPKSLAQLLKSKPKTPNAADPGLDSVQRVVAPGQRTPGTSTTGLGRVKAAQTRAAGPRTPAAGSKAAAKPPVGPHGGAIDPATGAEVATSKTGPIGNTDPAHAHTPAPHPLSPAEQGVHAQAAAAPGQPAQPQDSNPAFNELHPREHGRFVQKGDSGQDVANTQQALNAVGGANLTHDGEFGDRTEKAVKRFQKQNGLQVDGIVGTMTSAALRRKLTAARQVHFQNAA
jgi:peptidoglycan hydrolase-like protein with peptidoglycan-binding domain